jgi:hypothetical protein
MLTFDCVRPSQISRCFRIWSTALSFPRVNVVSTWCYSKSQFLCQPVPLCQLLFQLGATWSTLSTLSTWCHFVNLVPLRSLAFNLHPQSLCRLDSANTPYTKKATKLRKSLIAVVSSKVWSMWKESGFSQFWKTHITSTLVGQLTSSWG